MADAGRTAPRARKRPPLALPAVALALAGAAGTILWLADRGEPPPPPVETVQAPAEAAPPPEPAAPESVAQAAADPPAPRTPFIEAFMAGIAAFQAGDAHGAAKAFEAALQINPHAPQATVNLGFAYVELGQPAAALELFDRATRIQPLAANAYYGMAEAFEALDEMEAARGAMRTYLHLAPEDDPFRRRASAALWEWENQGPHPTPPGAWSPADVRAAADADAVRAAEKGEKTAALAPDPAAEAPAPWMPPPAEQALFETPLTTLDGEPATLAAHSGRVIVLNVWAMWCGPCRRELPSLDALSAALKDEGVDVVGVSIDDKRAFTREYLRDLGVEFPSYWDGGKALSKGVLDTSTIPLTLILSPEGEVLARHVGALDWAAPEMIAALRGLARGEAPLAERVAKVRALLP